MYLFRGIFLVAMLVLSWCCSCRVLSFLTLFDPLHHCIYSGSLLLQHKDRNDTWKTKTVRCLFCCCTIVVLCPLGVDLLLLLYSYRRKNNIARVRCLLLLPQCVVHDFLVCGGRCLVVVDLLSFGGDADDCVV